MPRIDPLSLLRCLSVLLGPTGGIKSKEEVHRLANLMTKFSKKLVSKCIYIQILKTTNTDLLSQFMTAGGWNLIHTWLTDGILAKNWALIQELLELLLLCPVDIERLKSNNCPKLIKGLSKEGSHQGVRILASRLVEQWLKIVKGEAAPNSVPAQIMTVPVQTSAVGGSTAVALSSQQHYSSTQQNADAIESATVHMQDLKLAQQSTVSTAVNQAQQDQEQQQQERLHPQTVQLQIVGKAQQAQIQQQATQQNKKQSFVVVSSQSSVPVYKITIRDGNQVLAKVETDPANINSVLNTSSTAAIEINGNVTGVAVKQEVKKEESEELEEKTRQSDSAGTTSGPYDAVETRQSNNSEHISSEVKQTVVSTKDNHEADSVKDKDNKDSKDIVNSDSSKSSDKENRDSHKKDEKKSSSISDKKSSSHHHSSSSKSSSKHSSSSSTHRSSSSSHKSSGHRSGSGSSSNSKSSSKDRSSKDKDKHHSSSSSKHSSSRSKSERDKEREKEKEKQKKDQAEKDKATLEKVQGQALSSKLGKIPKKRSEDEKSGDTNGRKSSIDSRDSSKENKEKVTDSSKKVAIVPEKKNISISIESRKNSQDSMTRPKTVKTFNSKFRSTGLEEEVKPPPPRSKKPNPVVDKKVVPQKLPVLKRPSPIRDAAPLVEKRAKLSLDSPTSPADEKKGGIKLIPPKPKPMVLQESDMFMDALTASTKNKELRKRKRRISTSKDGSSEPKKQETAAAENRESTPPASPSNPEDKSSVTLKPNFKFYQDTLEIEDDKEQKEKENSEEDLKKDKDLAMDDDKDNRDDDDGSNTPTPEEDVEDTKDSESPEDASSSVSDSSKKDNISSYSDMRHVDGLKSVLVLQKRKGPKKVLKWKTDLESIRYFELDETERVNVTKTFTDMKQMEKQNEREAFEMARKLNNEDLMEERTRWKPLIPIDLPPPLVEPGKDSREKDIQYAREKGILQALYFNRSMIPDSAAEPDEERHVVTESKIIPLDDLTGNKESEKDFTSVPWPEPKPQLIPQPPAVTTFHYPTFPHNQQPMMTPMGPQPAMGPMSQMQQMMAPTHMGPMGQDMTGPMSAGGWRTGDGKVVVPDVGMNPMANMSGGFNQGMEGGPMVPPGMMGPPPMYNQQQEGYGMMVPEDMGGFNNMNPNNFQGPPGPMFPPGPNFPGPRGVPMHNRGRGGPGWYRGGGPGRGGWRGGGGGWRGSGKQPPVCRQFSKNGYCRVGDKCQYLHPGVNCPPF